MIETISHARHHPSWRPQFTANIADSKPAAASRVRARMDDIQIYTDGSGYKGNIGAAAIIPETGAALRCKLGKETKHTVFEGELVGILLALTLLEKNPLASTALITLDNQAAIQALQNDHAQPAQYLLDEIHATILKMKRRRRRLRIHLEWVPGHMEIKGNELADTHAKMASEGNTSNLADLPHILRKCLPESVAALKAQRKGTILQRWRKDWSQSPRFEKMSRVDSTLPNRKTYKMLSSLSRRATSIIVQLRTGHVSLNLFLKKIKAEESALCKHCREPETVAHYLKHCKRFTMQRGKLRYKIGKASHSIPRLLGDPKIIPATLRYIQDTGRFDKYTDIAPKTDYNP
jgi:ribonuclease HI